MHKICAFLVPFSPDEGAERAAAEAEEVLLSIADENNWYTIIGVVLPDGNIVDLCPESESLNLSALAEQVGKQGGWLDYVRGLEYEDTACALKCSPNAVKRLADKAGKEHIVKLLALTAADLRRNTRHRQRAARRLVVVLDDGWPLPEVSASLYDQSVFCCDADPEEAAIVLLGIHV